MFPCKWLLNSSTFASLISRETNLSKRNLWIFSCQEDPHLPHFFLSIFWAIFENTLKLIRDQLFLLGRWYLHDHQHLINHMNELLKVFINLQTMKLLSIDPSEISLFRYHHAYIWFHGDKNHHIWLNHHWSNAHMKCQLKLRISHLPYQRSDYNLRILEDVLIIHYFPHSFQHILFQYPYLVKHLIRIRSAKL